MSDIAGKLREGSKTEYDLEKVTAENREKEGSTTITIFDDGEFKVDLQQPILEEANDQTTTSGDKLSNWSSNWMWTGIGSDLFGYDHEFPSVTKAKLCLSESISLVEGECHL